MPKRKRSYTWDDRSRNKTAFSGARSALWKKHNWVSKLQRGHAAVIDANTKMEIIAGFQKFYPRSHEKWPAVAAAVDVKFELNSTYDTGGFVLIDADGVETTVSKKCTASKVEAKIKEACRGSVHAEQILPFRQQEGNPGEDVDHCNPGGFKQLVQDFRKKYSTKHLQSHIVKNDVRARQTAQDGFYTFKDPILSEWREFHRQHAQLQCVTKEDHKTLTKKRTKSNPT